MREAVVRRGFEGVADGVAVVQDRAQATFVLVFGDHARLEADGVEDEGLHGIEVSRTRGRDQGQVIEVVAATEEAHLDRLGEAVGDFGGGQRAEPVEVGRHQPGPDEGADEVLALWQVDSNLAPDRAVDHSEEGGREHDQVYSAHVGPGDEATEVPYHPAAEGEEGAVAGQPHAGEASDGVCVGRYALRGLARGHLDRPHDHPAGTFELPTEARSVEWAYRRVGKDRAWTRLQGILDDPAEVETRSDEDGVWNGDGDLYRLDRHASTSSATREGGRPSTSTSTSATSL